MRRRNHGFMLKHRSLAARTCDGPRHYLRKLYDTLSIRFWLTGAIASVVFAVGFVMAIPLVWVTAAVGAMGLVALGFFATTQSFVRDVRDDRRNFRRFRGP